MPPAQSRARGRTIDPTRITNFDDWIQAYKDGYSNVRLTKTNTFVVYAPNDMGGEPVQTIVPPAGEDMFGILAKGTGELRARAETVKTSLDSERAHAVDTSIHAFTTTEQTLLEAVDVWNTADSTPSRSIAAIAVGRHMHDMELRDKELRDATYPKRHIQIIYDIPRKFVDPKAKPDQMIQHAIYRNVPIVYSVEQRSIATATDTA